MNVQHQDTPRKPILYLIKETDRVYVSDQKQKQKPKSSNMHWLETVCQKDF